MSVELKYENSRLEVRHFETVEEALEEGSFRADEGTFLLTYSPSRCVLAKWDGDAPEEEVFEFRVFDKSHEIRWVREASSGGGRAVLLRESSGGSIPCLSLPGKYLLWGTVRRRNEQGATLFEHRTGEINVPVEGCARGDSIALSHVEYFKTDDYGNLTFFAERLTGLGRLT
jgi:CRISPR-associated protein (TIGR03984 family)